MKKMVSIFLAASTPFLVSAQNGSSTYIDKEIVRKRWKEILQYEAEVIKKLEVRGDRIH